MSAPEYILDTECYRDYFLLMMMDRQSRQIFGAEMYPGKPLGLTALPPGRYITFNGNHYDMVILALAFAGYDNQTLKNASDDIIVGGLKSWQVLEKYGCKEIITRSSGPYTLIETHFTTTIPVVDHIDLIEVAPGQVSLKAYGGRLHSKKLQDLPIDPAASITPAGRIDLQVYCQNDLTTTEDLRIDLTPQIELREKMSAEYGLDLRSKSDAQIAEAVIKSQLEKRLGRRIYRQQLNSDYGFQYRQPRFLQFQTPGMQAVLVAVLRARFTLDHKGVVQLPQELESLRIRIANGVYRMGNGGLHSSEKSITYNEPLIDRDVTSYYPEIILTQGLYPPHLGPEFLEVFRAIVEQRIVAKKAGDSVVADALKIVVNGSFGKLGSMWSVLYAPDLMIQVTISGQLMLLMLIEMLELSGVTVVSANTDGVVMKAHPSINDVIAWWELTTGMKTEETRYTSLHAKDVNNYIAIKEGGGTKLKGLYAPAKLSKNPTNTICIDAALAYLQHGVPVEDTITQCNDVRKFLTIRKVDGGGQWGGQYLGKMVRWYYSTTGMAILYQRNGNKVAKSDGAKPMMNLDLGFPIDIDYLWYITETKSILADLGL
jgi:hypothetical protein